MPNTYSLIASSTVGAGGAANIDFTSIPATYTDLCVYVSTRTSKTGTVFDTLNLRFNGDTGSNYTLKAVQGSGSAASSYGSTTTQLNIGNSNSAITTSNTFNSTSVYIPNYLSSTSKSVSADDVLENNATEAYATLGAGLWTGTSAITSIRIYAVGANFVQYSTAYLYGIKKD